MPGTIAPTSQLAWLISITAISVLSWSRAVRDRLKSLGCGIGVLHRFFPAAMVPPPRRPPHTILFLGSLMGELATAALYGPSGVNWKVPMRGGACEGRARYGRKGGVGRFGGTPPLARLSRHKLVFGRSEGSRP